MESKVNNFEDERPRKHIPFFRMLEKVHTTVRYTSYMGDEEGYKNKNDGVLKKLQAYAAASQEDRYNELVKMHPDRMFRRSKGKVYEMFNEENELKISVALQVKEHSLTWYFWNAEAFDQYPQEFRDIFYNAAAQAHKGVDDGCDLYYRGSNSVHIKLMHHHEAESNHNHNHYRLRDNKPYTPLDFNQHMEGLKNTEAYDQFFHEGEIEQIEAEFAQFYHAWNQKQEGGKSKQEEYVSDPSQQLNSGDVIEILLFGHQQEPCRINVAELKVDYNAARKKIEDVLNDDSKETQDELAKQISKLDTQYKELLGYRNKGGSRGLFSDIASSRQIEGSENQPVRSVAGQDGSFGTPPPLPEWIAGRVRETIEAMINQRATPQIIEEAQGEDARARFKEEIPERVIRANMANNVLFYSEKKVNCNEEKVEENIPKPQEPHCG